MEPESATDEQRPPAARAGLRSWLREGLRASVLRAPRPDQPAPTPWELISVGPRIRPVLQALEQTLEKGS